MSEETRNDDFFSVFSYSFDSPFELLPFSRIRLVGSILISSSSSIHKMFRSVRPEKFQLFLTCMKGVEEEGGTPSSNSFFLLLLHHHFVVGAGFFV